jgi:hypothetical protein
MLSIDTETHTDGLVYGDICVLMAARIIGKLRNKFRIRSGKKFISHSSIYFLTSRCYRLITNTRMQQFALYIHSSRIDQSFYRSSRYTYTLHVLINRFIAVRVNITRVIAELTVLHYITLHYITLHSYRTDTVSEKAEKSIANDFELRIG